VVQKAGFFGGFGDSISFATNAACVPHNPQLAWRPASFQEWRQPDCEERHIITLLFRMRFKHEPTGVKVPLSVLRLGGRDEPDFRVMEAEQDYGVEVTQATTPRLQSATTQLLRSDSAICMEVGPELNIQHEGIRSNPGAWLRAKGQRLTSRGWFGMEPETQWADICLQAIRKKLTKLRDHYSKTYSLCDLLLYSNAHTPIIDLAAAVQFLKARTRACPEIAEASVSFRSIMIVSESWVIFDALGERPTVATKEGWP
jgi:hypothetical protein